MTPYPFQSDYLTDWAEGRAKARRQLIVSPTGSGKGNMMAWVAEPFVKAGQRVLMLVDQDNLVEQTMDRIKDVLGIVAQREQAEDFASLNAQVVVGMVQTMYRRDRLARWPQNHFGLVIADEADRSIADTWQTVLNHFDSHAEVCGFTATPKRSDQRNLGCYYDRIIEKEHLFSLIEKKFLCPIRVHQSPIRIDVTKLHTREGEFLDKEIDEVIGPHLEAVAKEILEHGAWRKTVVFLPLIKTAKKFAAICRDIGLAAEWISGDDPDRDSKQKRFKASEFDLLANSMLLTRGVDIPDIDQVVMLRLCRSLSLYCQCIGRGTRLALYKENLIIWDFLYQAQGHLTEVCRPARLVARDDFEARQITEMLEAKAGLPSDVVSQLDLDLGKLATDAASQREEALRKRLEEVKKNALKVIGPEEFALMHKSGGWVDYKPATPQEAQEPTADQLKWLRKVKVNPTDGGVLLHHAPGSWPSLDMSQITTRGQASKILDLAFKSKFQGVVMASAKQRALMARMGHPNAENATAQEARDFFVGLNKKRRSRQAEMVI